MHVVRTDLLCVVCIGLLSAEFSLPMFLEPLCLLSTLLVWLPQTINLHGLLNPNLYGGGGGQICPPGSFFATAQNRLALDC